MQSFGGALVEGCFLDLYGRFVEDALRCGCSAVDLLRFFSWCLFRRAPVDGYFCIRNTHYIYTFPSPHLTHLMCVLKH